MHRRLVKPNQFKRLKKSNQENLPTTFQDKGVGGNLRQFKQVELSRFGQSTNST
jgi:hypothetical protein